MKALGLTEIIRQKIESSPQFSITFAEYMELCLYHPEYGYYMKPTVKIGKQGDFYTSSSVHPIFAETFVDIALEISNSMHQPITLLEIGAGTGAFALHFLNALQAKYAEYYKTCRYMILERSPEHIIQQKAILQEHLEQIQWVAKLQECEGFNGMVLTNELFDAFPVHLVQQEQGNLEEINVSWCQQTNAFIERVGEPSEQVMKYVERYQLHLAEGQRMEIPYEASLWMQEALKLLGDAVWFIIDYGYTAEELAYPQYRRGSLLCYYKHQADELPLEKPGSKDITYHVHFDSLAQDAMEAGWLNKGLFAQHHFLLQAGILNQLTEHQGGDPFLDEGIKRNRAIRHFISPEGISGSFKVLVLSKGVNSEASDNFSFLKPHTFI